MLEGTDCLNSPQLEAILDVRGLDKAHRILVADWHPQSIMAQQDTATADTLKRFRHLEVMVVSCACAATPALMVTAADSPLKRTRRRGWVGVRQEWRVGPPSASSGPLEEPSPFLSYSHLTTGVASHCSLSLVADSWPFPSLQLCCRVGQLFPSLAIDFLLRLSHHSRT
jgi:hypothetical protein